MKEIKMPRGFIALVDDEDFELVSSRKWFVRNDKGRNYAISGSYKCQIKMHRFLMNPPSDMVVDHKNGNTLDNRRSNLRVCSIGENTRNRGMLRTNTHGLKGVTLHRGRWIAQISVNSKNRYLGSFDTKEEAHEEYRKRVVEYHGEFANTGDKNGY